MLFQAAFRSVYLSFLLISGIKEVSFRKHVNFVTVYFIVYTYEEEECQTSLATTILDYSIGTSPKQDKLALPILQ